MADETSIYIVAACRTPIGNLLGSLKNIPAYDLGAIVIKEALQRAKLEPEQICEVIMGQTLTAGQGQNPARHAANKAGIPYTVPSFTINMLCGSGLKSIYLGWQAIRSGEADIVVAGGQENMSMSQHTTFIRQGCKIGHPLLQDSILVDGLIDPAIHMHMGDTAENLAQKYNVVRILQDEFALSSQKKTAEALEMGYFDKEIVPVQIKTDKQQVTIFDQDEFPRKNTTIESLTKLRPVFSGRAERSVTSGNASGVNDGAAAVVIASGEEMMNLKLKPLVKLIGFSQTGIEPEDMGLGPIEAVKALLDRVSWTMEDVDLFELNEAFAVQALICQQEIGIPDEKLNVCGGAISLGHPIACSGARILVTLIYNLIRLKKKRGIATVCIGGGMGLAVAIEREEFMDD